MSLNLIGEAVKQSRECSEDVVALVQCTFEKYNFINTLLETHTFGKYTFRKYTFGNTASGNTCSENPH